MSSNVQFAPLAVAELIPDDDDDDRDDVHQQQQRQRPASSTSTTGMPLRAVRSYQDGFSDSICDLFADPYDRSSCCALTCCGTLLQDRNKFILTGEMPPPWWLRILIGLAIIILPGLVVGLILEGTPNGIVLTYIVVIAVVAAYTTHQRHLLRRQIMREFLGTDYRSSNNNNDNAAHYDVNSGENVVPRDNIDGCGSYRPRKVHRICSCVEIDHVNGFRQVPPDQAFDPLAYARKDFCAALWQTLAQLCCGCCGCWFNCWGVCATAQEHRELRKRLPKDKFKVDYITMQSYHDYYPRIEEIRTQMNHSFFAHLRALSSLSRWILGLFMTLLAMIALIIILGRSKFPLARMIVVLATMGQAMVVLYLVCWQFHRFDLSMDAVIKFFGAGFIFSTCIAMIVEIITGLVGYLALLVLALFEIETEVSDDDESTLNFYKMFNTILFMIFVSYVTAGMTEEFSKYFSFWMVEHPDFPDHRDEDGLRQKGIHSTSAAITAGLVATAAGFACAENLLYVFGEKLSLSEEIEVLLLRSCLPVHPLCAAIQSIGICRRDLEKNNIGIGQALLPAVVLHGTFDFALMLLSLKNSDADSGSPSSSPQNSTSDNEQEFQLPSVFSLVVSFAIMAAGVAYYFINSKQQRERLNALVASYDSSLSLTMT